MSPPLGAALTGTAGLHTLHSPLHRTLARRGVLYHWPLWSRFRGEQWEIMLGCREGEARASELLVMLSPACVLL